MTWDIATHPDTGDWLFSGNRDYQHVEGENVVAQRIRHRLKIVRGEWVIDPTGGSLGSRLESLLHLPRGRALREASLVIREALAPMDDIEIAEIHVHEHTEHLRIEIDYTITETDDFIPVSDRVGQTLTIDVL